MERGQLKAMGVGVVVGLAAGFLLARAVYVGNMPQAEASGTVVTGPAAPGAGGEAPQAAPGGASGQGPPPLSAEQQKMHEEINSLIERAKADPKDREARVRLGNITFDNGIYDMAAKFYEEALALQPNDPAVLTDCGIAYRNMKNSQKALELFQKAVAQKPDHVQGWFNIAIVKFADQNDIPGARAAIKKVLEIDPAFKGAKDLEAKIAGASA